MCVQTEYYPSHRQRDALPHFCNFTHKCNKMYFTIYSQRHFSLTHSRYRRKLEMIETREALCEWRTRASQCPSGRITLDLEADSLHRYHEKLCLIQYADDQGCLLIDPLSIEDMSAFSAWLETATVWMHGADYDMTLFRGAFNCMPTRILDTQIAARLLGFRKFGLAHLVEHFFQIVLSKSSQKADWSQRPLSEKMLEYAANDVRYMLEMSEKLVAGLEQKGRYGWFIESCEEAMQRSLARENDNDREHWRIQGSGKLASRGLAALKLLWEWRDREAEQWDRPSFMVLNNSDLILWSQLLQDHNSVRIPVRFPKSRRRRLEEALAQFHTMDESDYPVRIRPLRRQKDENFDNLVNDLIKKRDTVADRLDLEGSFIASRAVLEEIVRNESAGISHLMNWQKEILGF